MLSDCGSRIGVYLSTDRRIYLIAHGTYFEPISEALAKDKNVYAVLFLSGLGVRVVNCHGMKFVLFVVAALFCNAGCKPGKLGRFHC